MEYSGNIAVKGHYETLNTSGLFRFHYVLVILTCVLCGKESSLLLLGGCDIPSLRRVSFTNNLPSVFYGALGKYKLYRVPYILHSANKALPSVLFLALGK